MLVTASLNGQALKTGDVIKDFRGEDWKFISILNESKVYVRDIREKAAIPFREFFIHVFPGVSVESIDNG